MKYFFPGAGGLSSNWAMSQESNLNVVHIPVFDNGLQTRDLQ